MARGIGIALILLGLAGLVWGGVSWNRNKHVDIGPIGLNVTERKSLPIPPLAGAAAVVAGLALVFVGGGRRIET